MWDIMYQILGVSLMVFLIIIFYKIYITSNHDNSGIARNT